MICVSDRLDVCCKTIIYKLESLNIPYDFDMVDDEFGYCVSVVTKYGMCLISDSTDDHSLRMYVLNNNMVNWAFAEGYTEENFSELRLYVEVSKIDILLKFLTSQIFTPIKENKNYDKSYS